MLIRNPKFFYIFLTISALFLFTGCQLLRPMISDMKIGTEVDEETMEITKKADTFSGKTDTIYASILLKNAPENTELEATWTREGREISEKSTISTSGTRYIAFNMQKPSENFRSGKYAVKIKIKGTDKELSKEFEIK